MKMTTAFATLLSGKINLLLGKADKEVCCIANTVFFVASLLLVTNQFALAQTGNALQCSGGYVTATGIDISNQSFTIEFWMKHTDDGNFNTAIGQGSTADNHGLHIGMKGGNQFYFNYYYNDFTYATPTDNNWHHWACVNDGATTTRSIYKDGVLVATNNAGTNFLGTGTLYIGKASFGGGFDGTLDEIRIWSTARTQSEIQSSMNSEISSGTGLLAAYHCNQGTANGNNIGISTLIDATGNYTGELNNFGLTGTTNNFVGALISGSPAALNFAGGRVHAFNTLTDNTYILGSQSATVEFWAKAAPNFSYPLDFNYDNQFVQWGTTIGWAVNGGDQYSTGYAVEDCWHHYAFTYDGATGTMYGFVDGQPAPNPSYTGNFPACPISLIMGGRLNDYSWVGTMDEVRIWNVKRTQGQLQANLFTELAGNESGLLMYYKFNQGTPNGDNTGITTLFDAQTNTAATNGILMSFGLTGNTSNWVTSGAMLHYPEIDIKGNSNSIVSGDVTPSPTDHTDFGNVITGGNVVRTFTISNTGSEVLNITSMTSSNARFTVSSLTPISPIPVGQSATFTVTFSPTAANTQTATITVNNDDCDEGAYTFAVTGTGVVVGAALNFNGTSSVSLGTALGNFGTNDFTLETKFRSTQNVGAYVALLSKRPACNHDNFWNIVFVGGQIHFEIDENGANYLDLVSPLTYNDGNWHHVACVRSGTSLKLYIDGALVASGTTAATTNLSNASTTYIGTGACDGFVGDLDETRIWSTARTCDQIAQLYNCELTGAETGLLAYYKFNQGLAASDNTALTSLTDATSNGNNGTFSGFALNGSTSNFIATGGVTTGVSCGTVVAPEIDIKGNTVSIPSGTTTTETSNHTDFGKVVSGGSFARTFTIKNTGTGTLTISNITSDNGKFVVSNIPTSVVAGGTATFTVTFYPTAIGAQNATITVNNNDCDEGTYMFAITGTGAVAGAALDFDGTDDYISVPDNNVLDLGASLTLEAWVRPTSFGEYNMIIDKRMSTDVAANYGLTLTYGRPMFYFWPNTSNLHFHIASSPINLNTWSHIAVTYDGATVRIFVNGTQVYSQVETSIPSTTNQPLNIGRNPASLQYFNGSIDEVRIWNIARSCAQIAQQSNCELVGNESGLVAYYKFNQGTAEGDNTALTSLTDATSNGNNGTFSGFTLNGSTSNFITPGGVTTGTSCPAIIAPEINLKGNGNDITYGSTTPTTANHTDFGGVVVNGSLARTFTIDNTTGTADLIVSSITKSGTNESEFVVSGITLPVTITAGNATTFVVTFTPTITGTHSATITVNNNDCDEGTYTFAITGNGANAGAALSFDGVDDYVVTSTSPVLTGGGFTVELWAKRSGSGTYDIAVGQGSGGGGTDNVLLVGFRDSNQFIFAFFGDDLDVNASYSDNNWHHWACVYTGAPAGSNNQFVYRDGVLVGSRTTNGAYGGSGPLTIGTVYYALTTDAFSGTIDEVRIWNTARSCEEIRQLRNCELTGSEPNLVAYYKFNQGAAEGDNTALTSLTDATSNGNNGTFNGFTLNGNTSNFITPGGVTTGTSCPAVVAPEINLKGNGNDITYGSTTSATANHTDFGSVVVNGSFARTFTIDNSAGTGALTISSITSDNTKFVVSNVPASVTAGGTATFTVTFNPTTTGAQNATITVNNNDCDEGAYTFAITGSGANAGEALSFDGADDYILTSSAFIAGQAQTTLEAWVKPLLRSDGTTLSQFPNNVISTDIPGSYGRGFGVNVTSSQSGVVLEYHNGFRYINYSFTSNTWYHVAVVYTSTNIRTYVNGTLIDDFNVANNPTNGVIQIGRHNSDGSYGTKRFFNGAIDDVRIWNTARTCDQISQLRNCELAGNESGLVAYYKFNQGAAEGDNTALTSLTDATANGNNGTFNGFTLNGSTSNFIAPGSVTTGTSCPAIIAPEINLKGNGNDITYGLTTPTTANHTDFGSVVVNGSLARTFTIENTGNATLTVSNITSSNSKFVVSSIPPSVSASGTATFTVTFNPTATGAQNATITVNNNDCDEGSYTFAVTGTGAGNVAVTGLTGGSPFVFNNEPSTVGYQFTTNQTITVNSLGFYDQGSDGLATAHEVGIFDLCGTLLGSGTVASGTSAGLNNGYRYVSVTPFVLAAGTYRIGAVVYNGGGNDAFLYNASAVSTDASVTYVKGTLQNGSTTLRYPNSDASAAGLPDKGCFGPNFIFTVGGTPPGIPDIDLRGGSPLVSIPLGSTTPSASNHTDFGSVLVNGSLAKTYTISNAAGTADLVVSSITKSGTNQSEFTVSGITLPLTVTAGNTATFILTFVPTATGTRTATIMVNSNDCDETPYDFAVSGSGALPGAALHFDGSNDLISASGLLPSSPSQFTVEFWLKPESLSDYNQEISIGSAGNGHWNGFTFHSTGSGAVYVGTDIGSRMTPSDIPANTVALNTWQHFAYVYNNGVGRFYKNGVLLATKSNGAPPSFDVLRIGSGCCFPIQGALDELRIWNTARSCDQISQQRNCELTGTEPNLVAYYQFNQGLAASDNSGVTTLTDLATGIGGANNGTLTGFALSGTSSNWIATGGVTTGTSCSAVLAPEINVKGNSQDIADGSNSPATTNHTDFNGTFSRIFTIQNTGTSTLTISSITSSDSRFAVSGAPTSITANASAIFTVTYNPTDANSQTSTITINSNDCDEAAYDFVVTASATPAKALHFTDTSPSDNVNSPSFTAFGTQPVTIEFWAKNESSFAFPVGFGNSVLFQFGGGNFYILKDFVANYNTGASVSTNGLVWEHFALTWDGVSTLRTYKNGLPTPTPSFSNFAGTTVTGTLQVGEPKGGYPYAGAIDEVRMWNEQRTDAQILASYNTEIAEMSPCLQVYWKFNQGFIGANNGSITTAIDIANATNHNGTLTNFTLTGSTSNWVAGSGITEVTSSYVPAPEIDVQGGASPTSIADGDITPTTADYTGFGNVNIGSSLTRTFTILNTGNLTLNVGDITFTGANASEFSVQTAPAATVSTNGSTTVVIRFDPTRPGTRTAVMHVANDDCDEADYNFTIQGIGVCTFTATAGTNTPTVCVGGSITLTASAGDSYTWAGPAGSGYSSNSQNPSAFSATSTSFRGIYSVTVSTTIGCTASATTSVSVNALPVVAITPTSGQVCAGATLNLSATNGLTGYSWANSGGTFNSNLQDATFSSTVTGGYSFTITAGNGTCTNSTTASITVNALPVVAITPTSGQVCAGATLNLSATNGLTGYSWANSGGTFNSTLQDATFSSTVSGGYSFTVTAGNGTCTNSTTASVTVNALPVVAITPTSGQVCAGATLNLSATNGLTGYSWANSGGTFNSNLQDATFSSTVTGGYSFTITAGNGTCTNSTTASITVNALPVVAITPASGQVCAGATLNLSATAGHSTYSWSNSGGTFGSTLQNATFNSSAIGGYSFTVTVNNGTCTNTATASATVNTLPSINISVNSEVCAGAILNLSVTSGLNSYSWVNSGGTFSSTTNQATFSSAMSGGYSFTVTAGNGTCTNTATASVTVNTLPVVAITPASGQVCAGASLSLSATAGLSGYSWVNSGGTFSSTTNQATFSSTSSGGYSFSVTASDGTCTNTATVSVTVNALPSISIEPANGQICSGGTITLTATSGLSSYNWANSGGTFSSTTNQATFSSTSSGGYSFTVTAGNGTCTNTATTSVTVNTLPVVAITPASGQVCVGASLSLSATAGLSGYSWGNSGGTFSSTTNQATFSSTNSGGYSFTVTAGNGTCTNTATASVTVNTLPVVAITPASGQVCAGASLSLSATTGLSGYNWGNSGGTFSSTTNQATFSSTSSGGYSFTVTASDGTCTNTATVSVTVNALPSVTISPSNGQTCAGSPLTLTATSGLSSYNWGNSGGTFSSNTNQATFSSTSSGGYSFTVTAGNGTCTNTATASVTVNALPSVTISPSNGQTCAGSPLTLTATSGLSGYSWVNSGGTFSSTTNQATFSSTSSGGYSFTVTAGNGTCTNTATASVTVNTLPVVAITPASGQVCAGASLSLSATAGLSGYSWVNSGGTFSSTTNQATFSSTSSGGYSFTVTASDGTCTNTATVSVTVNALPSVTISPSNGQTCAGSPLTLTATSGLSSYNWANSGGTFSSNTNQATFSSGTTGNYSFTVTVSNGTCTNTAITNIAVNTTPSASIEKSAGTICAGGTIHLTTTGGSAYSWTSSGGTFTSTTNQATFSSNSSGGFSFTVTVGLGTCTATTSTSVTVNSSASVNLSTSSSSVCVGNSITLTVNGGNTYSWANSGGQFTSNANQATFSSTLSGNYTVSVTAIVGTCTASTNAILRVNSKPEVLINQSNTWVCVGQGLNLTATADLSAYSWANSGGIFSSTTNQATFSSTVAGTYRFTVTARNQNSCSATATASVTVQAKPTLSISPSNPQHLCKGTPLNLTATGISPYSWSGPNGFSASTATASVNTSTTANSGVYSIRVGTGECTATASISVQIHEVIASASSNGTGVCGGGEIRLNASGGQRYSWSGPASFSSTQQNPVRSLAAESFNGIYTVTVTGDYSCSNTATVSAAIFTAKAGSNSPVCTGGTIQFNASGGSSYSWYRPTNNFSSTEQNPILPNAKIGDGGVYFLKVSGGNGCTTQALVAVSIMGTTIDASFSVNPSVIVSGKPVTLSASSATGAYSWSGPNGFSGTTRSVTINPFNSSKNGVYRLTIIASGSCSGYSEQTLTVASATRLSAGEDQLEGKVTIKAYPNPADRVLSIRVELTEASWLRLRLLDMSGRMIQEWEERKSELVHVKELDILNYREGLYLLEVESKEGRYYKRVVKVE